MKVSDTTEEKELLLRLRNGDTMAFEEIYRSFQPALVFFARRLLFTQQLHDAEEVVQDSLMKFYDRRLSFEALAQIRSFLYITTKNACLQLIQKEKTRMQRYEKFIVGFEEADDFLLNEIIYTEAVRQLRAEIEKLPLKCREIMKKLIVEGKDANKIAEEMNITVSTVNNQKARAVSLLKNRLSGAGLLILLSQI